MAFVLTQDSPAKKLGSGKKSTRPALSPYEAKEEAKRVLRDNRLSPLGNQVLDALAVAGVLTHHQLHRLTTVAPRSLRRYYWQHLLDKVAVPWLDLERQGFGEGALVYTLGGVGSEVVAYRLDRVPTGYIGFGVHRILHDLMANETIIRLLTAAAGLHLKPVWASRYEATVHDDAGRPVLEPDAMLTLHHSARVREQFVLEYHHEDHAGRAAMKVERYERTYRDGHWQRAWATDEMPTVLVAFSHQAVATGYKEAVQASTLGLRCTYLGKPWASIVKGDAPGLWQNFRTGERVNILELNGA